MADIIRIKENLGKVSFKELAIAIFCVGIVLWISYFFYSNQFGLYEDDYSRTVGLSQGKTFSEMMAGNLNDSLKFSFGHPLGYVFARTVSYFIVPFLGLSSLYFLIFLIQLCTGIFVYLTLRKYFEPLFSSVGTLLFVLFPADVTKPLLVHGLTLQLSMLFFALALYFYFSQKRTPSYVFLFCSLITYATPFPIFFIVPLLGKVWNKISWKDTIRNASIMMVMLGVTVLIRYFVDDKRVTVFNFSSVLHKSFEHMFYGPYVSIKSYFVSPVSITAQLDGFDYVLMLVAFIVVCFFLLKLVNRTGVMHKTNFFNKNNLLFVISNVWHLIIIVFMISLGYALTLTTDIFALPTRNARIHMAGAFGAALLLLVVIVFFYNLLRTFVARLVIVTLVCVLIVFLVSDGLRVQDDYVRQWSEQQKFWGQVISLCPDLQNSTSILLESDHFENQGRFINALPWSTSFILSQLYKFPSGWISPRLFDLKAGWRNTTEATVNNSFMVIDARFPFIFFAKQGKIIFLREERGIVARVTDPIIINNTLMQFQDPNISLNVKFERGYLHKYMFSD